VNETNKGKLELDHLTGSISLNIDNEISSLSSKALSKGDKELVDPTRQNSINVELLCKDGSIEMITLSGLSVFRILRFRLPNLIAFLKEYQGLVLIVFESNSRLTRIESKAFSSLQSILIPSSEEILGSECF
jgi:hypothetical protein